MCIAPPPGMADSQGSSKESPAGLGSGMMGNPGVTEPGGGGLQTPGSVLGTGLLSHDLAAHVLPGQQCSGWLWRY